MRERKLCIDLFCGLGGWTEGFLAEGYDVIGFDIEQHVYGEHRYPAQLVIQDVLTIHGRQFRDATCIVASSPCQKYSYMAMPWTRAKEQAVWYRDPAHPERLDELNALFLAPQRIQREASEAAGRWIPMVQENVRGAQPWVGPANWHFGSYYLWGDVPALMPVTNRFETRKRPTNFHGNETGGVSPAFNSTADYTGHKNTGGSWFNIAHNTDRLANNARDALVIEMQRDAAGVKGFTPAGQPLGKNELGRRHGSKSKARKAASARIAKIPFPLASHIARCFANDDVMEVA